MLDGKNPATLEVLENPFFRIKKMVHDFIRIEMYSKKWFLPIYCIAPCYTYISGTILDPPIGESGV